LLAASKISEKLKSLNSLTQNLRSSKAAQSSKWVFTPISKETLLNSLKTAFTLLSV